MPIPSPLTLPQPYPRPSRLGTGIILIDRYNRPDNANSLERAETGQLWTNAVGTLGVNKGRAYSVTDASGDLALTDGLKDFNLSCILNGQTSATNQRYFNLVFRGIDTTNFLMTRINAGSAELFKNVAGAFTVIAATAITAIDNTDYAFTVNCQGSRIFVYVGGVLKINYTLTAGESSFVTPTKVGLRLSKAGAPTGSARADNFVMEAA